MESKYKSTESMKCCSPHGPFPRVSTLARGVMNYDDSLAFMPPLYKAPPPFSCKPLQLVQSSTKQKTLRGITALLVFMSWWPSLPVLSHSLTPSHFDERATSMSLDPSKQACNNLNGSHWFWDLGVGVGLWMALDTIYKSYHTLGM